MRNFKNNFRRNRYKNHFDRNHQKNENGSNLINDLQNGSIEEGKLVYEREVKRHFTDYSDMATQPYISLLVEQQLRQGETLRYYKDSSHLLEDLLGVRILDKGYKLVNGSIIRSMIEATVPIVNTFSQKDKDFVKNTIGSVLIGRAEDKEIDNLISIYNN